MYGCIPPTAAMSTMPRWALAIALVVDCAAVACMERIDRRVDQPIYTHSLIFISPQWLWISVLRFKSGEQPGRQLSCRCGLRASKQAENATHNVMRTTSCRGEQRRPSVCDRSGTWAAKSDWLAGLEAQALRELHLPRTAALPAGRDALRSFEDRLELT
jgi:hypothetical protein